MLGLCALIAAAGCHDWESLSHETAVITTVTHLPADAGFGGTAAVMLLSGLIDTDALTIDGGVPEGTTFDTWPQTSPGLDVAVWHVGTLTLSQTLRVIGQRPLVIIAQGDLMLEGSLDVAGHGASPGPGASLLGSGAAGNGPTGAAEDSGGGGGGFATPGANGGTAQANGASTTLGGGNGGPAHGDAPLQVLEGGSPGGPGGGGGCAVAKGGGGGGAVQLFSATRIVIASGAQISAGGGGGQGGVHCGAAGAGGGGGAGGAIFLQAPRIEVRGQLFANGGAGGAGAAEVGGASGDGAAGQDAQGNAAAAGGTGGNSDGLGGTGGFDAELPRQPTQPKLNAGGGGGAVGRIVLVSRDAATLVGRIVPAPSVSHD